MLRFSLTIAICLAVMSQIPVFANSEQEQLQQKQDELMEALSLAKEKGLDFSQELFKKLEQDGQTLSGELKSELLNQIGDMQQLIDELPKPELRENGDLVIPDLLEKFKLFQKEAPSDDQIAL